MASELKVDKFTGVTTAGSILVTGEGNSTTTNLQQGLTKHWVNLDGTGTFAISDSFNCASVTDDGTGDYDPFFTNNMSNTEYSVACGCPSGSGDHSVINASTLATNKYRIVVSDGGSSLEDQDPAMTQISGDLA
jgi:hypothetical protein